MRDVLTEPPLAHRQDIMVGDECAAHRHNLEVQYPVTNGASLGPGPSPALLLG